MKKKLIIGGVGVIAIAVIIGTFTIKRSPGAVVYNGKSLRNWALQTGASDGALRSEARAQFRALGSNAVPGSRMVWKDNPSGRFEAALALGSIGGSATAELIRGLDSNDTNIRYAAVSGLANVQSCDNSIVLALLKASGDQNAGIAVPAGGGLSKFGTNALPFLATALESPQTETRRQATRALGTIHAPRDEIVPLLLKMLNDKDGVVRVQAVQALGMSGLPNPTMVAGLVGVLSDPATEVRIAAIRALTQGHRMAARAVPDLVKCLDDNSPLVRQAAAEALGTFGTPAKSTLPRLTQAADDKDEKVRVAATGAIAKIESREGTN